ncbi:hypothetical protein V2G26_003707 [Clonostachys chloroleuca]
MFSMFRAALPPRTNRAEQNPIIYEDGASFLEFMPSGSDYVLRNMHPPFNADRPSIMVPPLHYHIHQTEHFRIHSGTCHLYQKVTDVPWKTISVMNSEAPKTAYVPSGIYHSLKNASTTEPMIIDVNLTPEDYEGEQKFFRNFFGYLDDCRKAEQPPSLFQLMVFLRAADTPLGLPAPTELVGRVASNFFMNAMGWYGKWILGYKESYPEYYVKNKSL